MVDVAIFAVEKYQEIHWLDCSHEGYFHDINANFLNQYTVA